MCQSDNNPTIEQTTAEGHQWVFNVARIPAPVGVLQLAPKKYIKINNTHIKIQFKRSPSPMSKDVTKEKN